MTECQAASEGGFPVLLQLDCKARQCSTPVTVSKYSASRPSGYLNTKTVSKV